MNNLNYTLNFELNPIIETLEAQTRAAAAAEGRLTLGLAGRAEICEALKKILGVFFPNRYLEEKIENDEMNIYIGDNLRQAARLLQKHIADALCLKDNSDCAQSREKADEIVRRLLFALPQIRQDLMEDVNTGYHGDPAALNLSEVILSYPFVETVAVYRVAHNLYAQGVPIIPRIMSEYAHSQSGIDIHPGAEIQPGFFIDHGTGVVIGETCRIGRNVIIYQGVALGAISPFDTNGTPIRGQKRHPDIEDDVIIYANATILGGNTVIGKGSVIGGNCWVTKSVPPHSIIYNRPGNSQHEKM